MTGFLQHFPGEHPRSFYCVTGSSFSTQQPVDTGSLTPPGPRADLLSPQPHRSRRWYLGPGHRMVLKAFSLLLSATKVGRWQAGEKTLQVDFPSGDVACQMGRAPWQGQRICRTAYSHFRSFRNCSGSDHIVRFSSLSQLQAHSKHKEK